MGAQNTIQSGSHLLTSLPQVCVARQPWVVASTRSSVVAGCTVTPPNLPAGLSPLCRRACSCSGCSPPAPQLPVGRSQDTQGLRRGDKCLPFRIRL